MITYPSGRSRLPAELVLEDFGLGAEPASPNAQDSDARGSSQEPPTTTRSTTIRCVSSRTSRCRRSDLASCVGCSSWTTYAN